MAKRVCVIDIGSNSVRMVVYEKTSRFAFHLLYESKSKVRLSQNAYQNDGNLQKEPMQRTFNALSDFLTISSSFGVNKILCVATSALRDAPNKKEFTQRVKNKLKLNIKVIEGVKEAYLGGIACANLLSEQENALSIDIGGGSTEFSIINKKDVTNTLSLNLGTVRLKELFFDKGDIEGAIECIDDKLSALDGMDASTLIGIGGTFRAISSSIMKISDYPLNKIHGYEYHVDIFEVFLNNVLKADTEELKRLGINVNRFDVIKPGTLILQRVLKKLSVQNIVTSGVGVREGVYLADLLRNSKDRFPAHYNTSVRYLLDAHLNDKNLSNQISSLSKKIFDLTHEHLNIDKKYRSELSIASKLYPTGGNVHFYSKNRHSYYLIQSALEYGFKHEQILLIATLARYAKNKLPSAAHIKKYEELLPDTQTLNRLSYIISLSIILLSHKPRNIDFELLFKDGVLSVDSKRVLHLSREALKRLEAIDGLEVSFLT
jgi:exopolyphosphatase/guanosine-5'-triphosphate,3'-diphosphate pyrophosphatase